VDDDQALAVVVADLVAATDDQWARLAVVARFRFRVQAGPACPPTIVSPDPRRLPGEVGQPAVLAAATAYQGSPTTAECNTPVHATGPLDPNERRRPWLLRPKGQVLRS
jgi:hypothetical protein